KSITVARKLMNRINIDKLCERQQIEQFSVGDEFSIRALWLLGLLEQKVEKAKMCFEECKLHFKSDTECIKLPNCDADNEISIKTIDAKLQTLEYREYIERASYYMYEAEEPRKVIDVLAPKLDSIEKHAAPLCDFARDLLLHAIVEDNTYKTEYAIPVCVFLLRGFTTTKLQALSERTVHMIRYVLKYLFSNVYFLHKHKILHRVEESYRHKVISELVRIITESEGAQRSPSSILEIGFMTLYVF